MSLKDSALPGFNIYHSNDMVCLSELVSYLMRSYPLADAFDKEWIVIPNEGMKGWVNKKIADSLGISMMIEYDQIWEFTWKLFGRVNIVEDEKPQERYRRENMVWTIYRTLPMFVAPKDADTGETEDAHPAFTVIRDYLNASKDASSFEMDDVKLFQLSEAIASVFDRYIVYRSEWIRWSQNSQNKTSRTFPDSLFKKDPSEFRGEKIQDSDKLLQKLWEGFSEADMQKLASDDASFVKQNAWQSILWKSIVSANALGAQKSVFGNSRPTVMAQNGDRITEWHIASLIDYFGKHVEDPLVKKNLPERIFVFAIPSLPQMFLDLMESLARVIPVHYMLFNPCRKYWGDVRKENGALDGSFAIRLEKAMRSACRRNEESEFEFSDDMEPLIDDKDENLSIKDEKGGGKNIVYSRGKSGDSQVLHDDEGFLDGGNTLLAAWGSLGRDNLCRLIRLQENAKAEFREFDVFVDPARKDRRKSVLSIIQKNIFELTEPDPFMLLRGSDSEEEICNFDELEKDADADKEYSSENRPYKSVSVRSCFTPMREVEAVYDEILARFDCDPSLKPNDIVVMVPDVNKYAPFIDAVFGTVPENDSDADGDKSSETGGKSAKGSKKKTNRSRRAIPYQISDQTCDRDSAFLESFMKILSLPHMRLNGKEILNLLNVDHIGAKFGITGDDWNKVCDWVKRLGISCDYKESDLIDGGKLDDGVRIFGVWERALDKLIFGSVMPSDGTPFLGDIKPCDDLEQSDLEIISRLKKFVDAVASLRDRLSEHSKAKRGDLAELMTARQWRDFITENILEALYADSEDGAGDRRLVESAISSLGAMLANVGAKRGEQADAYNELRSSLYGEDTVSLEVMRSYLERAIGSSKRRKDFLSGKVNFCTLEPMRSIPFKHIFVMGLDGDSFPIVDRAVGFDLTQVPHLKKLGSGDRSSLDDSRYLFLEALVSAEDSFYVSYVGRSASDATQRNPAVPVTELVSFISRSFVSSGLIDDVLSQKQNLGTNESRKNLFESYKKNEKEIFKRVLREDALSLREPDDYKKNQENPLGFCTYQNQWYRIAMREYQGSVPEEWEITSMITDSGVVSDIQLKEEGSGKHYVLTLTEKNLFNFLKYPADEFYEKRFDVKRDYSGSISDIPTDEPFVVNDKSVKDIKKKYLKQLINDKSGSPEKILERLRADLEMSGLLPIEMLSRRYLEEVQVTLNKTAEEIKPIFEGKKQITELIDLEFDLPQEFVPERMRVSDYTFSVRIRYPESDVYQGEDGTKHFIAVNMLDSEESFFPKAFVRALCFAVRSARDGCKYGVSFVNAGKHSGKTDLFNDQNLHNFRASVLFAIVSRYIAGMRRPSPHLWYYTSNNNDNDIIDDVISKRILADLKPYNRNPPKLSQEAVIENYCRISRGQTADAGKEISCPALSLTDWLFVFGFDIEQPDAEKSAENLFAFARDEIVGTDLSPYNQHVVSGYGLGDSCKYEKFDESVKEVVYASLVHTVMPEYFMTSN